MDQLYFGIYVGIILIMFLYNAFIYLTVKDINYLYYVFYILVVGITQACLKGYSSKLVWPENEWLIKEAPNFITSFAGISSILFTFNFLQVRKNAPWAFQILLVNIFIYLICIALYLLESYLLAQQLLQLNTGVGTITIFFCGFYVYKKGYKPALFFNISWSFFLAGVIIYILKDAGILPFNVFTSNSILIGSGLEATFLSFALADKINIYKQEKESSQQETLKALQENERITREQNIILESKVNERTLELTVSNEGLNIALTDLKEAESQLVESEKMASLGQLTAGIAHEINNPINFITSNVNPLKRDVDVLLDTINMIETVSLSSSSLEDKQKQIADYKEEVDFDYLKTEIEHLINGISDGASRTAEIVKGLRVFSRLDEDDRKKANINEGIDSTLVIVNNLLNNQIKVIKNYGDIPAIDCYPGKLNQVFLNIISNAIYAINKQRAETKDGCLKIITEVRNDYLVITFEDNGTGMDENTRKKIFEPFFTTKDVGDGTGLGMSIVYNTIQRHEGKIFVNSTPGMGTEFIIELPIHKTIDN
ncbi:MAG: 7TM diverse intracellular signaling domain-containing protein [Sphingobacteriaceae bacterium]